MRFHIYSLVKTVWLQT